MTILNGFFLKKKTFRNATAKLSGKESAGRVITFRT